MKNQHFQKLSGPLVGRCCCFKYYCIMFLFTVVSWHGGIFFYLLFFCSIVLFPKWTACALCLCFMSMKSRGKIVHMFVAGIFSTIRSTRLRKAPSMILLSWFGCEYGVFISLFLICTYRVENILTTTLLSVMTINTKLKCSPVSLDCCKFGE